MNKEQLIIIGSGPAGYSAAIYASRADLNPLLFKGNQHGGQLSNTNSVENFPGFYDGISGRNLMENFEKQAAKFGTRFIDSAITKVNFYKYPFCLTSENEEEYFADSIIIATGSSVKWLNLSNEEKYKGAGISSCAFCDGLFFKNQKIAVVGGGDSAAEEALYLSKICKQVIVLVRSDKMKASAILQNRLKNTSNIDVLLNKQVIELHGDQFLENIKVKDNTSNEIISMDLSGLFVAIGHNPNSNVFAKDLALDKDGYIITLAGTSKTSINGIFAAGDVQDKIFKQAVTAAASGCNAAIEAQKFLSLISLKIS